MKKIIFLIPVFNDWESLKKLLYEINEIIQSIDEFEFSCIIINDSSTIEMPKLTKPKYFNFLKILNMKKNKGHARCNAFGLNYIYKNQDFDFLILMDGDGEDRPIEIRDLVNKILKEPTRSVVAKRVKRSEGIFFQLLYQIHKLITYIFTGKKINFGNYSCILKRDIETISKKASLWSSYSGTIKKYLKHFNEIDSIRGKRYFGPSRMSLFNLIIHSLSIIAVFKFKVLIRSIIMILLAVFLLGYFKIFSALTITSIVIFNIIIFTVSLREKRDEIYKSHENLKDIKEITN